jgi:hypothetical protein
LTQRTVERMRQEGASNLHLGAYTGWIRLVCNRGPRALHKVISYHHGYGGGGPVTRDVIQSARKAVYLPDADIVWSGHTHDSWQLPIERLRLSEKDNTYTDRQVHVKTAGYKRSHKQQGGWEIERGMPPKPIGAYWLRMYWNKDFLDFELTEAK